MHLLVLSAFRPETLSAGNRLITVSMHLLVLSAFRPDTNVHMFFAGNSLNAPFGAQCFPTDEAASVARDRYVSMHLLVLSAFRL